jgi:hypothetical protein
MLYLKLVLKNLIFLVVIFLCSVFINQFEILDFSIAASEEVSTICGVQGNDSQVVEAESEQKAKEILNNGGGYEKGNTKCVMVGEIEHCSDIIKENK